LANTKVIALVQPGIELRPLNYYQGNIMGTLTVRTLPEHEKALAEVGELVGDTVKGANGVSTAC